MPESVTSATPSPTDVPNGLGILLIQLGTPQAPTASALRPYLRQFLTDPRVIENQSLKWRLILRFFILPKRPAQSAAKYQRIWDDDTGSPLLHWTKRQTELLQQQFPNVPVRFGMQIGSPSLEDTVVELIRDGIDRIVAVPMYPQYSATTTASAMDCLFKVLMKQRRVPAIRIAPPYYQHPAYLDAMAAVIRDDLAALDWTPDHYVLSFHGIPIKYAQAGDPYATHVNRTTQKLIERLGWPRDRWTQTYQSLFGRDEWLKPYTEQVLQQLAKDGARRVFVAMPGFTSDCLETLDEIGYEARECFREAGGAELRACPCLNDHPRWIDALKTIVSEEACGWLE